MGKRVRYTVGITFAFFVLLINQVYIQYSITQIEDNATLINQAGYQRMLSQRIALIVQEDTYFNSKKSAKELLNNWKNQHYNITEHPFAKEAINKYKLEETIQLLEKDILTVESLIKNGVEQGRELDLFRETIDRFLINMDKTVNNLESFSNSELERLKLIEIILFVVSILLLFGEVLFVFRPIQLELNNLVQELGAQNTELKESNEQVREQKAIVDAAFEELDFKNNEILDSISYAQRIQNAILPSKSVFNEQLSDSFLIYKPKDMVSGDFYWLEVVGDKILFAVADCTGHGVPGAMISLICNSSLNRAVREYGLTDPGQILDTTREIVVAELEKSNNDVKDGMDISICSLDGNLLKFAGSHQPLWIVRKKDSELKGNNLSNEGDFELQEIKGHSQPIGKFFKPSPFTTHTIDLKEGDSIYLFTDGFADQFGGVKGKKFKTVNFKNLILSTQNMSLMDQREEINNVFEEWQGDYDQLDDVCVLGVRV